MCIRDRTEKGEREKEGGEKEREQREIIIIPEATLSPSEWYCWEVVCWYWLDLFNAELSPERYWRGPKSQGRGDYTYCNHKDSALSWAAVYTILLFR